MFVFENGLDTARLENGKIITDFSMKIDEVEGTYLVHIPAYNIHFYTNKEEDIEQSAHESLVSFFKYWIKEQGLEKLNSHMLSLGFSIKSIPVKPILTPSLKKKGSKFIKGDEFLIS